MAGRQRRRARRSHPRSRAVRTAGVLRWVVFGVLSVVLLFVLAAAVTDPSSEQPKRAAAAELKLHPKDADAYQNGVVFELSSVLREDDLNLAQRIGLSPRRPVLRTEAEMVIPKNDNKRDLHWVVTLSQDAEISAPDYSSCEVGVKEYSCKQRPWVRYKAGDEVEIPVLEGKPRDPTTHDYFPVRFAFWIRFNSLTRSFEFEGGDRTAYNGLALAEDPVLDGLALRHAPDAVDLNKAFESYARIDALRGASQYSAARGLWLCPDCLPTKAFMCLTETQKDQYLCWGRVGARLEAAWTTPSYPWSWLMPIFWQTVVAIFIAGIGTFVAGPLIARLRDRSKVFANLLTPQDREDN